MAMARTTIAGSIRRGQQVSINAARGDNTMVLDLRATKFVDLGGERRIGLFAEFFNVLNTVNFGNSYGETPEGRLPDTNSDSCRASAIRDSCSSGRGSSS